MQRKLPSCREVGSKHSPKTPGSPARRQDLVPAPCIKTPPITPQRDNLLHPHSWKPNARTETSRSSFNRSCLEKQKFHCSIFFLSSKTLYRRAFTTGARVKAAVPTRIKLSLTASKQIQRAVYLGFHPKYFVLGVNCKPRNPCQGKRKYLHV